MKWKDLNKSLRLNIIGAIILLVGLSSATLIYLNAGKNSSGVLGYEAGDGAVYPINPEDSKQYLRDLELYGGKANVLMDQFRRWFEGLWQGKSLAFIIAGTTIIVSFGLFYVANYLIPFINSDVQEGPHRDGTET
jgi:hypothetical protein